MGLYDGSSTEKWKNAQNAPNAPAGVQQGAKAAGGVAAGDSLYEGSRVGQWVEEQGLTSAAATWYGGANMAGTTNGWNTDWRQRAYEQYERMAEQGRLGQQFSSEHATGVVTWDHSDSDGNVFNWGDVYDNGKKVGNVFEQFDRQTANVMMAEITLDGTTKAHLFKDTKLDPRTGQVVDDNGLGAAVAAVREKNNTEIPQMLKAEAFNRKVERTEGDWAEGDGEEAALAIGGAVGGGAMAGAAGGAIGGPIGAAVGAVVGGVAGGVGAYLNQDSLIEQAARAHEITKMSLREHGAGGYWTGLGQWAGFGGKMISPFSNLVQGGYDKSQGKVGDRTGEFYRLDRENQATRSKTIFAADVAATVVDSLLQFASPVGVTAYTAQMGGTIVGEVGEVTFNAGEVFDYKRGGFDNVFTDEQGNFDASSAAAGIGKVGIDVVQLGMVRGLAGKADAARRASGLPSAYGTGFMRNRLPKFMGGRTPEEKAALAAGGREIEAVGHRFTLSATGELVGSGRRTLSLLAPSEQLPALTAKAIGMRSAAVRKGAVPADEFFKVAHSMATGERKITTMLVNALGESYEEGLQTIFESHSHGHRLDFNEIRNAAIYGGAAGLGMGAAFNIRTPSGDQRMKAAAQFFDPELTDEQWAGMAAEEKRSRAQMSKATQEMAQAALRKIQNDYAHTRAANVAGVNHFHQAVLDNMNSDLKKGSPRTDGAFVITQHEEVGEFDDTGALKPGSVPNDSVVTSALQMQRNLSNHQRGLAEAYRFYDEKLKGLDPSSETFAEDEAKFTRMRDMANLSAEWGRRLDVELDQMVDALYRSTTSAEFEAWVEDINQAVRQAYNREIDQLGGVMLTDEDKMALARSVSLVFTRDPQDHGGSYQMLLPQVSVKLAWAKANDVAQVSHAILPAIGGDYDGDKIRQQAMLALDDFQYENMRSGAQLIGAGTSVNVGAPVYENYVMEFLAEGLSSSDLVLQAYAEGTLISIGDALMRRYSPFIDNAILDEVIADFYDAAHAGAEDARKTLLDGLALKAGPQLTEYARGRLTNEWLWLDQLVRSTLQEYQGNYVEYRPASGDPDTSVVPPHRRSSTVKDQRADEMAVLGMQLGVITPGDSMFRKFQKLHFSSLVSTALSAETSGRETGERMDVAEMAALYEAIGQQLTQSEIDNIRGKDSISNEVYGQLTRIADSGTNEISRILGRTVHRSEALAVIANMKVLELDVDENGTYLPDSRGHVISLTQMLLKRAIARDKRKNAEIIEISSDLQAKYARLDRMVKPQSTKGESDGAEEAFIEVIGSQQLFTLLGQDADRFGPQLTAEQWLRGYVSMSETDRREEALKLTDNHPAYLGRQQTKNLPYDLSEVQRGEITAYRAVVDALLKVGNSQITMDESGKLSGEKADRSDRAGEAFRNATNSMREALFKYLRMNGRQDGELNIEVVERFLDQYPDSATAFMALIPNSAANAVFERREGKTYIADWFLETLLIESPEAREMHYLRNVILGKWAARGVNPKANPEDPKQRLRDYTDLDSRFHQVMFELASMNDGGAMYTMFLDQMQSATSVAGFLEWVNTTAAVRGRRAPLTAWVDDTNEFDRDKASGGWTTTLPGAVLREAMSALQKQAELLVADLGDEAMTWNDDKQVIQAIEQGDTTLRGQLQQAIDNQAGSAIGLGPATRIQQTVGAAWGFYSQAHNKGESASNVRGHGAFEAYRDAFGHLTGYNRMMGALTAVDLSAINGSMPQVARDGGRSVDSDGRQVMWEKPTVDDVVGWLKDPETRGFARSVIFPQAVEQTPAGTLRPQMLTGKSLRDLLSGATHNELFPAYDDLSLDQAMRYITLVGATEREFGGHFEIDRLANDMVIAALSSADSTLSVYDVHQMTVDAYFTIALVLQKAGSRAANLGRQGHDPLAEIKAEVVKAQQLASRSKRLGKDVTDAELDELALAREREMQLEIDQLMVGIDPSDAAEVARVDAQKKSLERDFDRYRQRIELLRDDNPTQLVVEMFSIPADPVEALARQSELVAYVAMNNDVFRTKATAITNVVDKLMRQLADPAMAGAVDLGDPDSADWKLLSRAAISIYLDEAMSHTGTQVSVPPYPDLDTPVGQRQARYFDTSFSYLVEPLLDSKSPLVRAAAKIHHQANRWEETASPDEIVDLIKRRVYGEFDLGTWTSDIPRASIEANTRLDSSASGAAISMPGVAPQTQATFSAATKRRYTTADDWAPFLSTASLTWSDLESTSVFDDVQVQMPTGTVLRPLAQLNNRFARSVTATYTDAAGVQQSFDLLSSDQNLGLPFPHPEAEAAGLQAVHLDRLRSAVATKANDLGIDATQIRVAVEFLHPDTQPSAPEWMNSLFFEGTSFKIPGADVHESLIATLWFANGSISPALQAAALQASKKGKPALTVVPVASSASVKTLETNALTDWAEMLREKTRWMFKTDLGFGRLDPEFYNAVYKDMKLHHWLRGNTADGEPVLWSSEQVIEFQQANPGQPLPFENPTLWVASDNVLRAMLGEQGKHGVPSIYPDQLEVELTNVPRYEGATPSMQQMLAPGLVDGETIPLSKTEVAKRARQSQLQVSTQLSPKTRSQYETQLQYFNELKLEIGLARSQVQFRGKGGFNTHRNMNNARVVAGEALQAENIALDMRTGGVPFVGPRDPRTLMAAKVMVDRVAAVTEAKGNRTGWVYEEGTEARLPEGYLSGVSLEGRADLPYRVMPGDLVVVLTDSFKGNLELAQKRMDFFAGRGATVVLVENDGGTDMRTNLARYLRGKVAYERMPGSNHVFVPANLTARYQNQRARESSLMAVEGVSPRNYAAILNVRGYAVEESAAWVNHDNPNLATVSVALDLVPVDFLGGYNVPVESLGNTPSQIEKVRTKLRGLNTTSGRKFLRDLANRHLDKDARKRADKEFDEAFRRMMQRFEDHPGSVMPETGDMFGTGDLIPLIDNDNRILLYRHGYEAPNRDQVNYMSGLEQPAVSGAAGVAVFPSNLEPQATTHGGRVASVQPRAGHGLSIELQIDMQVLGGKFIAEWNGMKYVVTPRPNSIRLPDHGFFANGRGIDIIASLEDALSKESHDGMLDNHRIAFMFFGFNFLPDVAKYFKVNEDEAYTLLTGIARKAQRISIVEADEVLRSSALPKVVADLLHEATGQIGGVDAGWVESLSDETVEAQITRAIVIYLLTDGARVENVLSSGGFNDPSTDPNAQSRRTSTLFTQFFDRAPHNSALRTEMFRRFNAQLHNPRNDGTGYYLTQTWDLEARNTARGQQQQAPAPQITYAKSGLTEAFAYINGQPVGRMTWALGSGEIGELGVLPAHQRKGVATGLLKFVRDQGITITHSSIRSAAGEAWAQKTGDVLPEKMDFGPVPGSGRRFYHGTSDALPETLLTRDQTLSRTGSNLGPGFYTTSSKSRAEYYAGDNGRLYEIQGGEKILHLSETATADELRQLAVDLRAVEASMDPADYGYMNGPGEMADKLDKRASEGMTWADVMALTHGFQEIVSLFLERTKGVDALERDFDYYGDTFEEIVWLRPEKLKLAPAEEQAAANEPDFAVTPEDLKRAPKAPPAAPTTTMTAQRGDSIVGRLQIVELHAAAENPIKNGQAFDELQMQQFSRHSAAMAYEGIGADTVYTYDVSKARAWANGYGIDRFDKVKDKDRADGGVWRMLTGIDPATRKSADRWRAQTPAEAGYRKLARAAMVLFRQPLETNDWAVDDATEYRRIARDIVHKLGLLDSQVELVDFWIRQHRGAPLGRDRDNVEQGNISASSAIESANDILANVKANHFPTIGGMAPLMHLHDLQAIHRANRGDINGWHPVESPDPDADHATDWEGWVKVAIGSVLASEDIFDPLYLRATDGFLHTYMNSTRSMLDLRVTLNADLEKLLLDPDTNLELVSINPNIQLSSTQTLIVDYKRAGLAELIGGVEIAAAAPAAEVSKKLAYTRRWRKERKVPVPVKQSMRNYRVNGDRYTGEGSATSSFVRSLIHLRVAMAMLNPALYVSMGPEQWVRGTLDRMANTLTGQSTAVRVNKDGEARGLAARMAGASERHGDAFAARIQARRAQLEEQLGRAKTDEQRESITDRISKLPDESMSERMGFTYRYTPKQLVKLAYLSQSLGDSPLFESLVYSDLNFRRPHAESTGRIERGFARAAALGAKFQDPTWGTRSKTLARRYLDGALQYLEASPLTQNLTPDLLVAELATNPKFLQLNFPEVHKAGMNSIAQIRSLKQTMANKMLTAFIDPMAQSSHAGVNTFANLFLKLPTIFSGYAMNVATTITGMQGADQMLAMFMHGRGKGLVGKLQARLRGDAYDPEVDDFFDFSDVLEGIDLSRAFLRGGLTHAGLFQLGMMAGGLGLSGEDDETRKLRRLAAAQGAGFVYDPRKIENDFRNSDAIYLDWLPFNLGRYFQATTGEDGRQMAEVHWMLKQVVSPIMGMEKFFETGDVRHVQWGFADAIGSFPLVNALMWDDAVSTANEFAKMADAEQELGSPQNMVAANAFLTNMVGTYERMLLENSFVNQVYIGWDRYDRDPYALPLRNSDGVLQRDIEGNPRENDLALEQYRDPETGQLLTGYQNRTQASGTLHALTENRFTLATLMSLPSLFTGMADSDYYRANMALKVREVDLPDMTQADSEALVRMISESLSGGQPTLNASEIGAKMKSYYASIDKFVEYSKIDATAEALARKQPPAPLSVLDKDGREKVTNEGARAILRGLAKGTVKFGEGSLAGVYITREMRMEIQKDWTKELTQEGVDMGLDPSKASSRATRLMQGPLDDPSIQGLADILWSNLIPYEDSAKYKQLNTTYVIGPDGRPWATAYRRDGILGSLGLKPLQTMMTSEQGITGNDRRLNTTDYLNNLNTGLRGLELMDPTAKVPTAVEIGESLKKAIEDAAKSSYTPFSPYNKSSGGYGGYGYNRYGYGGYGGGGGYYGSGGSSYFSKMYTLPNGITPYGNSTPMINTSNPLIRRESVRRERVWSERGRLKQWQ